MLIATLLKTYSKNNAVVNVQNRIYIYIKQVEDIC